MNKKNYNTPILIFTYKRLKSLKRLIKSIKLNKNYNKHKLYILSDGSKKKSDQTQINKVRSFCKKIRGFKSKKIILRKENFGLAQNITMGVSELIKKYGSVIVLEDDLVLSKNFLEYINLALAKYKKNKKVWHITGWSDNLGIKKNENDVYFSKHMNCWGWATWLDRWKYFEKNPNKLVKKWKKTEINKLDQNGIYNNWSQVLRNKHNQINTWAVFWNITIFKKNGLCLNPINSLVINKGDDQYSTHTIKNSEHLKLQKLSNIKIKNYPIKVEENILIKKYLQKKYSKGLIAKITNKFF
tara:strand:- start:120 stop:1016 length:897 start_codon:yes stop_codon:yes gene_type:complete